MNINVNNMYNGYLRAQEISTGNGAKPAGAKKSSKEKTDVVSLSSNAVNMKEFGSAAKEITQTIESSAADKIVRIRDRIDAGTYDISSVEVADAILGYDS